MNDAYEYGSDVVLIKDVAKLPGLELGKIYEICHAVYGETGISGYRIRERLGDPDRWKGESWFVYPYEIAPVEKVEDVDSELIGKNPNFAIADEVEEGVEMEEVIYKVGDEVRIVNEKNGGNFGVGYVGIITKAEGDGQNISYCVNNEWWYMSDELELVSREIRTKQDDEDYLYKVGDTIRVITELNGYDRLNYGQKLIVSSDQDEDDLGIYTYDIDGEIEDEFYLFTSEVELVRKRDNPVKDFIPVYDPKEEEFSMPIATLPSISSHIKMGGTLVEEKVFTHERYNEIVNDVVNQIKELSEKKGGEYAGDVDRLANFRRNAKNLDLNMEDIWSVYAAKHWDAIQQYVKDLRNGKKRERLESISGRAHDLIVYLILFLAMVEERNN